MKGTISNTFNIFLLWLLLHLVVANASTMLKERPVIGILSVPNMAGSYYIAASYVKWLESAGARAIEIPFDAPDDIVESIFLQVNGILFPGGATTDMPSSAKRIWNLAKEANDNGDFFPLWGTCLGFELMVMLAADDNNIMHSGFDSYNISLPLFFTKEAPSSRMFQSKEIRNIAESNNITMNNHQNGIGKRLLGDCISSLKCKYISRSLLMGVCSIWLIYSTSFDFNRTKSVSRTQNLEPII